MQWIFMLVGLAFGAGIDESFTGALLGGLMGLGLGQAIRLQGLARENAALRSSLDGFAARFDKGTQAIHERLLKVEMSGARPAEAVAPATTETAATQAETLAEADDELVWELPPEALGEPTAVAEPPPAPQPASAATEAWSREARPAAAPEAPRVPPRPREPSLVERGIAAARNWLFGGNTVLRVGVLLLFLGLAFLLRYATEGMVVPVELRYAGVALSAIALLGLGWWLRRRNPNYGLMLQGAGIAVLYLTVFAAMRLHPLLDPKMAFGLLVAVTLFSAILAVAQDALGLAAAAALGGFAAPILASTGSGSHVALFSYFALLNAGIFAIAWFKAWRLLNLIGFVGTFGIGFAWGLRSYRPELFASTEPFLVVFFLMYVGIGLLFARRKLAEAEAAPEERGELLRWSARQGDMVDGTVLFGPPIIGFGLQVALIRHIEFGVAFSALALGLFYLVLARILVSRTGGRALLLVETCLALGVVFGSLAIPLGLDARWTSAAWAVEGAGIYWLGLRQGRPLARGFALLLQFGAALAFLGGLSAGTGPLLEGSPLGALMLGVALLFVFWQLRKAPEDAATDLERRGLPVLACVGLAFVYLMVPLLFAAEGTAIAWALAGLATLFAGLRLQSHAFLFSAFAVQLLGGAVFLLDLDGSGLGSGGVPGWRGLMVASLVGLGLIAGMLLAARDERVRADSRLLRGLSLVLLAGLAFVNLAVLFVLPWRTASAVWAGSGLLILWLSLHLQQRAGFWFGLFLQVLAGMSFLAVSPLLLGELSVDGLRPFAHAGFWTPAVMALAAFVGAWRLQRVAATEAALGSLSLGHLAQLLLVWSAAWWALAWLAEIGRFASPSPSAQVPLALLLAAASVAICAWLAGREQWRGLALLCLVLAPAGVVALAVAWAPQYHPAADFGWAGWAAVFVVHLWTLRLLDGLLPGGARSAAHVLGCWLLLGVLALELRYLLMLLSEQYNAWRWLGWALLPSAWLLLVAMRSRLPWPLSAYPREYRLWASLPLALLMLAWFWIANAWSDGAAEPLPYLPLFNPLELGLLFALLGVCLWLRDCLPQLGSITLPDWLPRGVAGASLFALATAAVFRCAHHWGGVPYALEAQLESMLVQAGLSIVWTSIALGLMVGGHLRAHRELWLIGAGLIALVVAKLFFVELGNRGGLERIVSFIGVGVLLLVVGYFAPLPPRRAESEEERVNA